MSRLKNRKGFTFVMMGFAMIVFIGVAAMAVDYGRMYLYRTQLHTGADAAALAAVQRLMVGATGTAADTGVAYAQAHLVDGVAPTVAPADIVPGAWNFNTGVFTPAAGGSWTLSTNNAVKATSRYTASYIFGRALGLNTRGRSAESVAAIGSVGATDCLKPWAIPYEVLLGTLYPTTTPGNPYNPAYNLTASDVTRLNQMTAADSIYLKVGDAQSTLVSGSFYGVREPPILYANGTYGNPQSGGNVYQNWIQNTCTSATPLVGVGDWLQGENGNMVGPTRDGIVNLCGFTGNKNKDFNCSPPVQCPCGATTGLPVKAVIWDVESQTTTPPQPITGGRAFRVKYVGVWVIVGWRNAKGSSPDGVIGYFSTLTSSGEFSGTPGPIKRIALVR